MIVEGAVVGTGVMGENHARILSTLPGAQLAMIVDADGARARELASRFRCPWSTDVADLAGRVDAAVLAVPTDLHHPLGLEILDMGVHLLVEKPIAATVSQAEELVAAADRSGRILAVGHVERFNPVCLDLPLFVKDPFFIQTRRFSPYSTRISEGVTRDMLIHDVDLVLSLAGSEPETVSAVGITLESDTEDLVTATVTFPTGLVAQLTAGRVAQHKIRHVDVLQPDSMVSADLMRQNLTIRRQASVEYTDDRRLRESAIVEIPFLTRRGEPLWLELEQFVQAVSTGGTPLVDGPDGLAALMLCERIEAATTGGVVT